MKDDNTYDNSAMNHNTSAKINFRDKAIKKEVTLFDNIGGLKGKIALNIKNSTIPKTTQVCVTGPIRNNKTGKPTGLLCLVIVGKHGFLKAHSSQVTSRNYFPKSS